MQIQRNLSTDSSVQEVQRVSAMVEVDSKAKVGASLGYNVRTLLKDLGLEVRSSNHFIFPVYTLQSGVWSQSINFPFLMMSLGLIRGIDDRLSQRNRTPGESHWCTCQESC